MELMKNLKIVFGTFYSNDPTCGGGDYRDASIIDTSTGATVRSGITCPCGRGCGNKACARDDWNYHDTDIEQYRAD